MAEKENDTDLEPQEDALASEDTNPGYPPPDKVPEEVEDDIESLIEDADAPDDEQDLEDEVDDEDDEPPAVELEAEPPMQYDDDPEDDPDEDEEDEEPTQVDAKIPPEVLDGEEEPEPAAEVIAQPTTAGRDDPTEEPAPTGGEPAAPGPEPAGQAGPAPRPECRMVIAIASGKGGVGKTLLAANVGIYLAQLGKRVVLVDADLGAGSLHTLLGMKRPRGSLHAFLRKEVQSIVEVVAETPITGLSLVPAHDNAVGAANPRPAQKTRLLGQLRSLPVDYVVIDMAAGTGFNALDIFLSADLHVVVTSPEPTACEGLARFIKSAFIRKVRQREGLKQILDDLRPSAYCGIPTPHQIYVLARERDPALGGVLREAMGEFKPRLVLNKTRTRDDLELGPALAAVGRRHLTLPIDYLGHVENDDMAWVTVRRRRPLLVEYPETKISRDIQRIARRMVSLETKERPECVEVPTAMTAQNHYEILGLHPGASNEEVRRAQRRVRNFYGQDSTAIYGIAPPVEVDQMYRRIDEAYGTLVDPEKRHLYNQSLFPGGQMVDTTVVEELPVSLASARAAPVVENKAAPPEVQNLPEMPDITPDTEFSGPLLQQVREAMGLDLAEIADRTKITMTYLHAIEEEDYAAAPAPVYLRGFIKTVARELRLDPVQVATTYMERYDDVMDDK